MTEIRNVAIIAHVDHGKTTLVDEILKQANIFRVNQEVQDCVLDSNDLERERGITILSKNISVTYKDTKINIIDTPGHSDFGGQVERVLKLADGVLLLVDAAEGPMPQTRFVLDKALKLGLKPVVVINKIDKPDARPNVVHDKVFDLFCELDANEEQLEFPLLYGSGRDGWVVRDLDSDPRNSILPLMDAILECIPAPKIVKGPVQAQVASLDYSDYVGRIGIGRVYRGELRITTPLSIIKRNGLVKAIQIKQLFVFEGLGRKETDCVKCGDLCAIVGIEDIDISDTITDPEHQDKLPLIAIDEPTISMLFRVNDSPFYGREGKYVSSRHLRERLLKEIEKDVALHVEETSGDAFKVSGRGVLHLAILIETMRREGYEIGVAKPQVIYKTIDGVKHEPFEALSIDVPTEFAGKIIEMVGIRKGEMTNMEARGERQLIEFSIPTRGLIGLRSKALTLSTGEAIVSHRFLKYAPFKGEIPHRIVGSLVSMGQGVAAAYAMDALQQRGVFFIPPNTETYQGMIVGEHSRDGELMVNLQKTKNLTNVRSSGTDRHLKIAPHIEMSLEQALEYVEDDELVEITPGSIRLRKIQLSALDRKRNKSK